MDKFHVAEHFISINGEGKRAGQLAHFIRFAGCNLACRYCDTKWANEQDTLYEAYRAEEIYKLIKDTGVTNITLTGGEPLLQKGMKKLLLLLREDNSLRIEIETNGSVDILPFMQENSTIGKTALTMRKAKKDNVSFTLDYKLPVSGMEEQMCCANYRNVRIEDTVKFVVGTKEDLIRSRQIIEDYKLVEKGCGIYLSPCFGRMEPKIIVNFLIENKMNDVNIQLQLHKYIWNPEQRGV